MRIVRSGGSGCDEPGVGLPVFRLGGSCCAKRPVVATTMRTLRNRGNLRRMLIRSLVRLKTDATESWCPASAGPLCANCVIRPLFDRSVLHEEDADAFPR